jgi:hypothetical protein
LKNSFLASGAIQARFNALTPSIQCDVQRFAKSKPESKYYLLSGAVQ